MAIKIITPPTSEPVTLEEAKAHLRVDGTDDDAYIAALISAAREGAEHLTGRALMPQALELALQAFDESAGHYRHPHRHAYRISLPRPPFVSITSITYIDAAGVSQTLGTDAYLLDDHSEPARLMPAYGTCWPETRCQVNAVLIRYQAGYANAAAVPQQIKNWMLLKIESVYDGKDMPEDADRLLDSSRIWSL